MNYGLSSECSPLQAVLLLSPGRRLKYLGPAESVLHEREIDFDVLEAELAGLAAAYRSLNVAVHFVRLNAIESDESLFNIMYARDPVFMTPKGAIIGRMGREVRREEPGYAKKVLESQAIPVLGEIEDGGTFEGADAVWLNRNKLLIGIGNRTNMDGFFQVQRFLKELEVECVPIPFEKRFPQHLLGLLQVVDSCRALVRTQLIDPLAIKELKNCGVEILGVPESAEVSEGQAMNVVTINPGEIIMPDNSQNTRKLYLSFGIRVLAEVPVKQLINGGGGIACATLPLSRR